jgi:hypothetical protein
VGLQGSLRDVGVFAGDDPVLALRGVAGCRSVPIVLVSNERTAAADGAVALGAGGSSGTIGGGRERCSRAHAQQTSATTTRERGAIPK